MVSDQPADIDGEREGPTCLNKASLTVSRGKTNPTAMSDCVPLLQKIVLVFRCQCLYICVHALLHSLQESDSRNNIFFGLRSFNYPYNPILPLLLLSLHFTLTLTHDNHISLSAT
jgi:hypothetical protein